MSYTLDHVLQECADDRLRSDTSKGRPIRERDFYESCWQTFISWIESRISKRLVRALIF